MSKKFTWCASVVYLSLMDERWLLNVLMKLGKSEMLSHHGEGCPVLFFLSRGFHVLF